MKSQSCVSLRRFLKLREMTRSRSGYAAVAGLSGLCSEIGLLYEPMAIEEVKLKPLCQRSLVCRG